MTAMYKLGKQSAKFDRRTLKIADYLDTQLLPTPPVTVQYSQKVLWAGGYGMLDNDKIGDCVIAAIFHLVMQQRVNAGFPMPEPTVEEAIAAYSAIGGYNPRDPSTDNGCNVLDALTYWKNTGVTVGGVLDKAGAFVSVNINNPVEIATAQWLFGGLIVGVEMPKALENASSWTGPAKPRKQWAAGSWGGHCVIYADFDPKDTVAITWGEKMPIPKDSDFAHDYVSEVYAVLNPPDWVEEGKCPAGFALADLQADLARLSA